MYTQRNPNFEAPGLKQVYSGTHTKTVTSSTYGREATDLHTIFLTGFGNTDLAKQICHICQCRDTGTS
jgi:hypothetical protein